MKANLEIKHCKNFPDYYNIFGENFSGYGSKFKHGFIFRFDPTEKLGA